VEERVTDTAIESLARRDRLVVLVALALLAILAWAYVAFLAMPENSQPPEMQGMPGMKDMPGTQAMPGMAGMAMDAGKPWTATEAALMFVMWMVMMAAMMIPSAAPMVLAFAHLRRSRTPAEAPLMQSTAFFLGYLALWAAFSALATTAQGLLHAAALLSPSMASASAVFSGALLIAAGIYQLTPLKRACLAKCRTPLGFLLTEWRDGSRGAFVMGLRHGLYCVGCCWAMMALLFVAGVMNLVWIAFLALVVLAEKALPYGEWVGRVLGIAALAWGTWLLAFA
jgi:predicted metal-binding membrane protein